MARRKKVKVARKKTKAELASPEYLDRSEQQHAVDRLSDSFCDRLPQKRRQFFSDVGNGTWVDRFDHSDDEDEVKFEQECRKWNELRDNFLKEATDPLELHCFCCNWNCDKGLSPLLKVVKHAHCDAGTALRLYWHNDPYWYQDYRTLNECPEGDEREMLQILRTIERRFKRDDFATKRFPFDPTPWLRDDLEESAVHKMPAIMRIPIVARRSSSKRSR